MTNVESFFEARAADLLAPVYYAQLSSILQSKVLAMDETPIKAGQAGKAKLHQGFLWPLCGDKDEVAFPYGATRALTQAKEILGEVAGTLVTDGYGVYSVTHQRSQAFPTPPAGHILAGSS